MFLTKKVSNRSDQISDRYLITYRISNPHQTSLKSVGLMRVHLLKSGFFTFFARGGPSFLLRLALSALHLDGFVFASTSHESSPDSVNGSEATAVPGKIN